MIYQRLRPAAWLLLLCVAHLIACGGGNEENNSAQDMGAVDPPDLISRETPVRGGPINDDFDAGVYIPPDDQGVPDLSYLIDISGDVDTGPSCCDTRFALVNSEDRDIVSVTLVGTAAPLDEPQLSLTLSEDVWSVDVCMPPDYSGTYIYEVIERVSNEEGGTVEFSLEEINTFAPNESSLGSSYNTWLTAETCEEAQVEAHGQTGAPGE